MEIQVKKKKKKRTPKQMNELRRRFMQQVKKYYGVPYAKKYWSENSKLSISQISNLTRFNSILHQDLRIQLFSHAPIIQTMDNKMNFDQSDKVFNFSL